MSTLIYSPEIVIRIRASSMKNSIIDVSADIQRAQIVRVLGPSMSTVNFTLLNNGRKYDDLFETMDAFTVYLRRIKTMLCFTGYLNVAPKFAAVPGSVNLAGSCTMKRLQYFYWDPGTLAAVTLNNEVLGRSDLQDGGMALKARNLLTGVAGWGKDQIHIGAVPAKWFDKVGALADTLIAESEAAQMASEVGSQAYVNGTNPMEVYGTGPVPGGNQNDVGIPTGPTTTTGIGPGTGALPATIGKCSSFGGPGGGAYGNMALTGESGVHPVNPWYCAMRWPYVNADAVPGAKAWWVNRRILVVNPQNNKAVCVRAADWGPADWTGRVLDLGPQAIASIGAVTDDTVHIGFAKPNTPLGPVHAPKSGAGGGASKNGSGGVTSGSGGGAASGWGAAGDDNEMIPTSAAGISFRVNRRAAPSFVGFVNDLVKQFGYHPKSIGGYSVRGGGSPSAANPRGLSAHAWGAAIDIDPPSPPTALGQPHTNPYDTSAPFTTQFALPHDYAGLVALARKWNLGWGGEWIHSKDYMHFEVIGAPGSAPNYGASHPVAGIPLPQDTGGNWTTPVKPPFTVSAHFGDGGSHWASGHSGTDFATAEGTPIRPVGPGHVHNKGTWDGNAPPDPGTPFGNWVSVDHGKGVYTMYAHMLNPCALAIGTPVDSMSSTLGQVDSTGNVTGPHVHLELRLDTDSYDSALASGGIEKYLIGSHPSAPPRGVAGAGLTSADSTSLGDTTGTSQPGAGGTGQDLSNIGGGLFNVWIWQAQIPSQASTLLTGTRALMNDVPIMGAVSDFMTTSQRDFCSAPNGDFIGWFPDYYGHYGQAGKIIISPLEISADDPPAIFHVDAALKTHQYVTGAMGGMDPGVALLQEIKTAGIVSIEDPAVLEALLNVSTKEAEAISAVYLNRYGARPESEIINTITGARQEFYFACMKFMKNWSEQYQTSVSVTFMPEAFPGMLACFPYYGIQGYIRGVTHDIDLTNGGGFRTSISAAPWSSIGATGPKGLPRGGGL